MDECRSKRRWVHETACIRGKSSTDRRRIKCGVDVKLVWSKCRAHATLSLLDLHAGNSLGIHLAAPIEGSDMGSVRLKGKVDTRILKKLAVKRDIRNQKQMVSNRSRRNTA